LRHAAFADLSSQAGERANINFRRLNGDGNI
jgi:hypothetical protein